jgi:hypothetical protein
VLTFRTLDEAVAGVEDINRDYQGYRHAARHLAETHFATERVLPPLIDAALQ